MDRLAQEDLHTTAARLRNIVSELGGAHISATRAVSNGGPDFRDRIKTLLDGAEALAADAEEAAGPLEKHQGVRDLKAHDERGECPPEIAQHCRICSARKPDTREPLHGRAGFGG